MASEVLTGDGLTCDDCGAPLATKHLRWRASREPSGRTHGLMRCLEHTRERLRLATSVVDAAKMVWADEHDGAATRVRVAHFDALADTLRALDGWAHGDDHKVVADPSPPLRPIRRKTP